VKLIALAAAAMLALCLVAGAEASKAPEGTKAIVVHCTIFNDTLETNGSEGELIVIIGGEVRVDYVQLVSVKVTLTPSNDKAWNCSVSPLEMTFTASSAQGFRANLTIPGATYNTTCTVTVRTDAIVLGVPADTSQDSITVSVKGPSETPVIPPVKKPGGKGGITPLNMPIVVSVISLAAVVGAFLTFTLWKNKRERRDKKKDKRTAKRKQDHEDAKDEPAADEDDAPAPPRRSKTKRPSRPEDDVSQTAAADDATPEEDVQAEEPPQDGPDEQAEDEPEEAVEVETEERRAKRGRRPKRDDD